MAAIFNAVKNRNVAGNNPQQVAGEPVERIILDYLRPWLHGWVVGRKAREGDVVTRGETLLRFQYSSIDTECTIGPSGKVQKQLGRLYQSGHVSEREKRKTHQEKLDMTSRSENL